MSWGVFNVSFSTQRDNICVDNESCDSKYDNGGGLVKKEEILTVLSTYGIEKIDEYKIIDSSKQDDYRINIIIDGRYVLRINNPIITEGCLLAIERLVERYDCIRVKAPKLLKNDN